MYARPLAATVATALVATATVAVVFAQPAPDPAAGPTTRMLVIRRGDGDPAAGTAAADQFLRASRQGDETVVSFRFTDTSLTFVLSPLATLLTAPAGQAGVAAPGAAPRQVQVIHLAGAPGGAAELPVAANLVIEDEAVRQRRVTVSGDNLSLADAVSAIAKASNCNIFRNGETLVADWCGASP